MVRIAAIVLVLSVSFPQALLAGVVLKAGEIDSSKVTVGAYAEVIYGKGERDQVSRKWEKLDTVRGYIKAVDRESLTIGRGFWKERIVFERIQKLILAESDREIDRLKKTTDTLSVIDNRQQGQNSTGGGRIAKKLAGSVLGGIMFGMTVGLTGAAIVDCPEDASFCEIENFFILGWYGYVVGLPIGMNRMDPHDRFSYSLAGSLIGGAASLALTNSKEEFWTLIICPLVGATIMSEFFRKPPEVRRVSIGLLSGPKGRIHAVATLRF